MLKVKKLDPRAILPSVVNAGEDLGYDIYALEDTVLRFGEVTKVRTGISAQAFWRNTAAIQGYGKREDAGLLIRDRSSMASKGIVTSGGVIDHGYTGEIVVLMTNNNSAHRIDYVASGYGGQGFSKSHQGYQIKAGDKIAQMIPIPILTGEVVEVAELSGGVRGDKGFGSSGR